MPPAFFHKQILLTIVAVALLPMGIALGDSPDGMRLRWTWGGESYASVTGRIDFPANAKLGEIRILGLSPEQSGRVYRHKNSIFIDTMDPVRFGGFDLDVVCDPEAKIQYEFFSRKGQEKEASVLKGELSLDQLTGQVIDQTFPDNSCRVYVERAPGDQLKFLTPKNTLIFDTQETISFGVKPDGYSKIDYTKGKQLVIRLRKNDFRNPKAREVVWNEKRKLTDDSTVSFQLDAPDKPGVYQLEILLTDASPVIFGSPNIIAQRQVQLVVNATAPINLMIDQPKNLELVFENQPGRHNDWLPKFPRLGSRDLLKAFKKQKTKPNENSSFFEIDPQHWSAFPISLPKTQRPFLFEIDLKGDKDAIADVLIVDRLNQQSFYSELSNATYSDLSIDDSEKPLSKHRLLIWSRSKTPYLIVNNRSKKSKVQIRNVKAYQVKNEPKAFVFSSSQNRRLFAQTTLSEMKQKYSAPGIPESNGVMLDDWNGFNLLGDRMVRMLKASHFQGLVLEINQNGGVLYPSEILESNPAMDTGRFARSSRDPLDKDVLELWFRQFNLNQLTLVPKIEIPKSIAKLESLKQTLDEASFNDLFLQDAAGNPTSTYNFLNPKVQSVYRELILEVVNRYSHHRSFGGVAIKIGANQQLLFVNEQAGFNQSLVSAFQKVIETDQKESKTKLASDSKAAEPGDKNEKANNGNSESKNTLNEKNSRLTGDRLISYRSWRTKEFSNFIIELNRVVSERCGKRLMLDTSLLRNDTQSKQLEIPFPRLQNEADTKISSLDKGIDTNALNEAGVGMFSTRFEVASNLHVEQRLEFFNKQLSAELSGGLIVQRNVVKRPTELGTNASPTNTSSIPQRLRFEASATNSNEAFRRSLVEEIADRDVLLMMDVDQLSKRSLTSVSKRIWETFSKLPNTKFETITADNPHSPVVLRSAKVGETSYLYFVNRSPWPSRVTVEFETTAGNLRNLDGTFFTQLAKTETGSRLVVDLEPYDLIAGISDQPELKVKGVRYSLPEGLKADLLDQKEQLLAKIRFLQKPESLLKQRNPGFENANSQSVPLDWTFSKHPEFQIVTKDLIADDRQTFSKLIKEKPVGVSGNQKFLRLTNTTADQWGWIRAEPAQVTQTGRISLVALMRATGESPQVRLSIEGQKNGREFYRFGMFSGTQKEESSRIGTDWKIFAVHFNDVPTNLENFRVGVDMIGQGTVDIENFQVFDRWFDSRDTEALTKIVTLAAHKISEGEYLHAHRLMNSYWPKFIRLFN